MIFLDGKQIGYVLTGLKKYWVKRNFNVTESELLDLVPDIVKEFKGFLNNTAGAEKKSTEAPKTSL